MSLMPEGKLVIADLFCCRAVIPARGALQDFL
jgi:hypothetical protein